MAAKTQKRTSIQWRILSVLTVSMTLCTLVVSVYFFSTVRSDAIERCERETETTVGVFTQNVNYYFDTCVNAARSVYSNNSLMTLLQDGSHLPDADQRDQIFGYLREVYYSLPSATQIYLASENWDRSFLYSPTDFTASYANLRMTNEQLPQFTSFLDVYIEPTHTETRYGHVVSFAKSRSNQVFTLWIPIFNLPQNDRVLAYLAIDMPIDFLIKNSQLAFRDNECIYIVDSDGQVVASNDHGSILQAVPYSSPVKGGIFQQGSELVYTCDLALEYCSWSFVKTVPLENVYDTTWDVMMLYLVVFLLGMALVLVFNIFQIYRYIRPLKEMTAYMKQLVDARSWSTKETAPALAYRDNDEIGDLVHMFSTMMGTMREFTIQKYEMELAYNRSILKMLQAQINPHFIYNTIQCFATNALKKQDLDQYRMLTSFGQMMHYAMVLDPYMVPLHQELSYIGRYIDLHKMRFESTDEVTYQVDPETRNIMLPKMSLQPLVENSIIHGQLFRSAGTVLCITARCRDGSLWVEVADNGVAVTPERARAVQERLRKVRERVEQGAPPEENGEILTLSELDDAPGKETSIGVSNVYYRLLVCFGQVQMEMHANELGGTTVSFTVPIAQRMEPRKEETNESSDRG